MKLNRKITFLLALLALFYCVSLIQSTYAKYLSTADADTNITIARWNVLVNNQDISQNSNFSEVLEPTFTGNENIKDGVIAPTATGYFDITLDGSTTDVSFSYDISFSEADDNTVTDLKITKYEIDGHSYTYNGPISGNILLNDQNRALTVRVYVEWVDQTDDETMTNVDDTTAANGGVAKFKVNVNVIQLRG
ncbi:hypothetical protein MSH26_03280 [bacterium]|nr:hypothetical protein [bacterium]